MDLMLFFSLFFLLGGSALLMLCASCFCYTPFLIGVAKEVIAGTASSNKIFIATLMLLFEFYYSSTTAMSSHIFLWPHIL
jgi:hypothetical protein